MTLSRICYKFGMTEPNGPFQMNDPPIRIKENMGGIVAIIVLSSVAVSYLVFAVFVGAGWIGFRVDHPAVLGLPLAAMIAFTVVLVLRQIEGPIEFEGFGIKFRGASGQVIMWVVCFLAITGSIKLLW